MGEIIPPRPLAESDDRTRFDCGRDSLNLWFRRHGWANHVEGISRTNVICDAVTGDIIGYVTLSAAQIERGFLPKAQQRNKPDPVPATLLGQLAVHKDHQGRGYARSMLMFALRTALHASRDVGSFGVIAHPVDDQARMFYAKYDFENLPFDPRRAMIIRMAELEKSGISE